MSLCTHAPFLDQCEHYFARNNTMYLYIGLELSQFGQIVYVLIVILSLGYCVYMSLFNLLIQ